ncbi:MAG: glycosyltransferase family 4 protein [Desulfobacterales bacterium]|jgi:glycosyltransferase involved in cell wall biosynthesis
MTTKTSAKLCLASQHFFPTHGGAQLRFLRYLPGLLKRGIETRVLSGTPKSKKLIVSEPSVEAKGLSPDEILSGEPINDICIERVQLPDKAGWRRSIVFNNALLNYCTSADYRPDVVQVVSSLQPRSIPWVLRLRRLGIPVIYAYTIPATLPSHPVKRAYRKWTLRNLYRQLDCMVVGSAEMRDLALDIGVKTRFEVIPNGVNLKRFRPAHNKAERRSLRASLGVADHQRMVTTIGAVHPRKGSDVLLEAWVQLIKQFPQTHLFLVGLRKDLQYPNLNDFRLKLEELIAASGASEYIHFTGTVRNPEDYLRASDVFVFPSMREGLPNAVLEAMASGVPVILTPFIGLSGDLGRTNHEYLLAERDPAVLSATIARILDSNGLHIKLGNAGRSWVEKTMDLEQTLDRYAALYHELADTGRQRRLSG